MEPFDVIKAPVITEQSYAHIETGKYVFQVNRRATKPEIKKAIETAFSVKVRKVNVANVRGKRRRRGIHVGHTSAWKKAVVQLMEGHSIDIL